MEVCGSVEDIPGLNVDVCIHVCLLNTKLVISGLNPSALLSALAFGSPS